MLYKTVTDLCRCCFLTTFNEEDDDDDDEVPKMLPR